MIQTDRELFSIATIATIRDAVELVNGILYS